MKIVPVDCNYVAPEFATSYLLVENGEGFFVECNTNYAIPYLKAAALKEGLSPEKIRGLIITHVHLDHAGGAGLFLKEFANARLYAHPRAARHAIDPSKLIASATQVYGEAFMQKMYGTILPCPADRVVVLEDNSKIQWNNTGFLVKHTRGHANHHICIIEPQTLTLFSGDSFGVSYKKINDKRGLVIIPSTSPTDFDADAATETVEWIRDADINRVALTHIGFLEGEEIKDAADQLLDHLRFSKSMMERIRREKIAEDPKSETIVAEFIHDWFVNYYAAKGIQLDSKDLALLAIDIRVNAQGLLFAASKN